VKVTTERPDQREHNVCQDEFLRVDCSSLKLVQGVRIKECLNHIQARLNQVHSYSLNNLLALLFNKWKKFFENIVYMLDDNVEELHRDLFNVVLIPRLNNRLPAKMHRLQIDHTAARHCSRGCNTEILHLKHHCASVGHLNTLTIGQAKHLVIIEYCVHVFDPEGVYGAIEIDPTLSIRLITLESGYGILEKLGH
jgi:hypothetical protein